MSIAIVLLGGTISYADSNGFHNGFIDDLLEQSRIIDKYNIYSLNEGNSVDLYNDATKMNEIVKRMRDVKEKKLLVLVGTDRMVEIAKIIYNAINNKQIILTGAMVPFDNKVLTDSLFNFGYALSRLQCFGGSQTWIAMNGRLFHPLHTRKNFHTRTFENTSNK
jgi:L-asparaginase